MSKCDAAITAGGGTCLETAAIGLPTMIVSIAKNQILPSEAMNDLKLAIYCKNILEEHPTRKREGLDILDNFLFNSALRKDLSTNCSVTFQNSGVEIICNSIEKLALDLI